MVCITRFTLMRIKLFIFFYCCVLQYSSAQQSISSPFTHYGIGDLTSSNHFVFGALGNASVSFIDSTNLNFFNPSSYSSLGKGQPIFSLGMSSLNYSLLENQLKTNRSLVSIDHFAFGISFFNNFGICAGIKPFSTTGYEVSSINILNSDTLRFSFLGNGIVSEAFLGLSYRKMLHNHSLSFGLNTAYIFGNRNTIETKTFNSPVIGSISKKTFLFKDYELKFGFSYSSPASRDHRFTIASILEPEIKLSSSVFSFKAVSIDVNNVAYYNYLTDTSFSRVFSLPTRGSFGFKYEYIPYSNVNMSSNKKMQFIITGECKFSDWNKVKSNDNFPEFNSTTSYHLGIQYSPHYDFLDRSKSIKLVSRLRYRIGGFTGSDPWMYNGSKVVSSGFTFGLGLPIIVQRSLSSLNIAFGLINRSTLNLSLKETLLQCSVGVSISPAVYERWFKQTKID